MEIGDRVYVQEPWGSVLIPYVGRVVAKKDQTLFIHIDITSPLTSELVEEIVRHTGHSMAYFPAHIDWCAPMKEST